MKHTEEPGTSVIFWDIGLRASQLSHTNRGSRPEILEIAPGKNGRGRGKTKLLLWQTSEANEPWEVEQKKEEYNGDERIWKLR